MITRARAFEIEVVERLSSTATDWFAGAAQQYRREIMAEWSESGAQAAINLMEDLAKIDDLFDVIAEGGAA